MQTQQSKNQSGKRDYSETIKPGMPVVCSDDGKLATVDHLEGRDTIKLNRDERGEHHFIPLSWVTSVDNSVHLDRLAKEVRREWKTEGSQTNAAPSRPNARGGREPGELGNTNPEGKTRTPRADDDDDTERDV